MYEIRYVDVGVGNRRAKNFRQVSIFPGEFARARTTLADEYSCKRVPNLNGEERYLICGVSVEIGMAECRMRVIAEDETMLQGIVEELGLPFEER